MPDSSSSGLIPTVATLTDELTLGRIEGLHALFEAQGAHAPTLVWSPELTEIRHPVLRLFADRMLALRAADGTVSVEAFESADLSGLMDWIMVLEPLRNRDGVTTDFVYRHYGADIAATYGRDMTGLKTSEIGGYISVFFAALYRAVIARDAWVKSMHEPPSEVFARTWRRLIVPLRDAEGQIARLAVLNVADNDLRAGLEVVPDPVMVVRQTGEVTFANKAARSVFGERQFLRDPILLEAYSGITLDLSRPKELDLEHAVPSGAGHADQHRCAVTRFNITRSVICYRDTLYFLVVARPE